MLTINTLEKQRNEAIQVLGEPAAVAGKLQRTLVETAALQARLLARLPNLEQEFAIAFSRWTGRPRPCWTQRLLATWRR